MQKTTFNAELKKIDDKVVKHSSDILAFENRVKQKQSRIENLERYEYYLRDEDHFGYDGQENYLVFQPMYKHFERVIVTANNVSNIYIHYWQSKGLSNEQIKPPNISTSNDLAPILGYDGFRMELKFNGSLLRKSRVTYNHKA